jgi:exodeoxyribonuclease-3
LVFIKKVNLSMLKICTFNVNSIRSRKKLIINWLEHRNKDIDVLCFQELKVIEEDFPYEDFEKSGYKCEVFGQKAYNGVAICSKVPLENQKRGFGDERWDEQKRLVSARVGEINIINVYAPHGDLRGTDKFHYKLDWYEKFLSHLKENYSPDEKIVIVGDFNVAVEDRDVYDVEVLRDVIGTMEEERKAFKELLSWGLVDAFRALYPEKQQFTWWDYIGGAIWKDEGMRIDYILCTKPQVDKLKDVEVDLWPRRRRTPTPSDHTSLIGIFDG